MVMINNNIGNRTLCHPIQSVIILMIKRIGLLDNHLYGYKPNWTPRSPITIINLMALVGRVCFNSKKFFMV